MAYENQFQHVTRATLEKLKSVLGIEGPIRSLKIEWEMSKPIQISCTKVVLPPAARHTVGPLSINGQECPGSNTIISDQKGALLHNWLVNSKTAHVEESDRELAAPLFEACGLDVTDYI